MSENKLLTLEQLYALQNLIIQAQARDRVSRILHDCDVAARKALKELAHD